MKKKILSIALGLVLIAFTTNTYAADKTPVSGAKLTPGEKAVKDFNKQFKNSISPAVYSVNGGIILQSLADGHNVTLAYDKKGNWVYTIKRYPTESLAKDILDIVTGSYNTYGYFITRMEKIDQPGIKSIYVVHMQNSNSYKTLRVSDDEVELIQDFKKIQAGYNFKF